MMVCPLAYTTLGYRDNTLLIVNVLKGKMWNEQSEFDETKDKTQFRDYESACDRVKAFYKEQHGLSIA
jgi:hypothetical protein